MQNRGKRYGKGKVIYMKKVAIVGAGIAGLTAGVYAAQSGFEVTIFEQHTIPGGASTSWRRKGYLFEGGMHWLTGSSPSTSLHGLWTEIGALNDKVSIYNRDPFFTFEDQGKTVCLYRDLNKFRNHLLELAPEDEKEIINLSKDLMKFTKMQMPIMDIKGVKVKNKKKISASTMLSMMPALPRMGFYNKQSVREFAERFTNPILRKFLQTIIGPENNATGLVFTMATLMSGDGGYPEGGSLAMARRIADYLKAIGGRIEYGRSVDRVEVRNGAACGVIIEGELVKSDAVIVTQDTMVAIDRLFAAPIYEAWAKTMREVTIPMLDTIICLGVEADLSDLPESIIFNLEKPFNCGDIPVNMISMNNYAGYRSYAPEGCTAVTAICSGDSYDFWKKCKEDGTYEAEKEKLAYAYIEAISAKYPKISGKVTVWDVATPLTYERYLRSYKGSWMTGSGKGKMASYPSKPESIQNVYFASHRLMPPGGLPGAAVMGRTAVQYLCKDTNTIFQGKS
jgi:phytoene dehydrogenase-like protein